jgi:uncharacterized phiE125 gp8 family phage protein
MTRPLQSVERVAARAADDTETLIAPADYIVEAGGQTARLVSRSGVWPRPGRKIGGIEIDFTAGYGDNPSDVPEPILQALKLLVAHWYEVRNPVHIGQIASRVPDTVSGLLAPYKVRRL